ncbi:MAG: hypothetical protein ABSC94_02790 [Polyangiaceae bacterium]
MRTGLLAAVLLGASSAGASHATASPLNGAAIVRGAGRLKTDGTSEWRETSTADVLSAGVTVQASDDCPLEMTLPDGVTVTLSPRAIGHWMPGAKLPSETNRWTKGYHLVLEEGELEVRMPPSPKGAHAFLVSTKAGTLTDWRGQLHVWVRGEATAAAIYQGALVVGSNGQGFPVYDGAGILMRRGVNPDKTRGIPPSPRWEVKGEGILLSTGDGGPAPAQVAWSPVPSATEYRVEVAVDPSMVRVVERMATRESHVQIKALASARTWVHVRAVGPEGIVGEWSSPRSIRALRYSLPDNAFVAHDGSIVLPEGTTLALSGAEGLEVAYEDASTVAPSFDVPLYWSPLSGPLRLAEDAPLRIVHLRDPLVSGAGEARLALARRELQADVAIGPPHAKWPSDSLEARVEVRDPSGRIDATKEPVTVEALLDLTPLDVSWDHHGSLWRGHIPPRLIGDNAVVRVVVKDGQGAEIGRGFIELAPSGNDSVVAR